MGDAFYLWQEKEIEKLEDKLIDILVSKGKRSYRQLKTIPKDLKNEVRGPISIETWKYGRASVSLYWDNFFGDVVKIVYRLGNKSFTVYLKWPRYMVLPKGDRDEFKEFLKQAVKYVNSIGKRKKRKKK